MDAYLDAELSVETRHIDGIGIESTDINAARHLIVHYTDGSVHDAGLVVSEGVFESVAAENIREWLDNHPEATTTVPDGAITEAKIEEDFLGEIKNDIDDTLSVEGASADAAAVGDALAKTVSVEEQTLTDAEKAQARENLGLTLSSGAHYAKLPDGTLIQWDMVSFLVQGNTTAESLYFDFPIEFYSAPAVFPIVQTQNPNYFSVASRPADTTKGQIAIHNGVSNPQTIYIRYIAIGRWKE